MYKFENLIVWKKSIVVAKEVYILSQQLPKEETFGLKDQIRRSVTSISLNIAEGLELKVTKNLEDFYFYLENLCMK